MADQEDAHQQEPIHDDAQRNERDWYYVFNFTCNGLARIIIAGGAMYTLYKFSVNHPELFGTCVQGVTEACKEVALKRMGNGSILIEIFLKDKESSLKLSQDYEEGHMERRLKSLFSNFSIKETTVKFDSIVLTKVDKVPVKKNFAQLKEEANATMKKLLAGEIPLNLIENEIEFCQNADEPNKLVRSLVTPQSRNNEVILNGIPSDFDLTMAKDLVQQILNDPYSVLLAKYLRKSAIVMQLRTPELVKELLTDSPIKIGKKSSGLQTKKASQESLPQTSTSTSYLPIKTTHVTAGAQEQQMLASDMKSLSLQGGSKDYYQVQIYGVPPEFSLKDGRSLLQDILQDGSVVTDMEYLEKSVGPEKKHVIVAQMQTPERPKASSSSFEELWFIKPSFQRSTFSYDKTEGKKKQMMLVRQTPDVKQHLEEDTYVIEVHERSE